MPRSSAAPIERRELGEHDVLIDIAYAGICHSDIHQAREEWGKAIFPMVPGHEIAGVVSAVGSGVTKHAVGDRAGRRLLRRLVPRVRDVPGRRGAVLPARERRHVQRQGLRRRRPPTAATRTQIVVDENYALRIPDGISLDVAAPLLCAGITLYSPLKHWGAGPGTKVAIVGMGGLGHMGVQLAHALGAEVTVLSQSLSKQEDGLRAGRRPLLRDERPARRSATCAARST